jgi:2-succinyl-5-enolpyruvyl-6-hydroxy-3-cyclohexene-1-carboxylate synthase
MDIMLEKETTLHPLVDQLVATCAARGVQNWIIAPGSRSAPLTVALTRHPEMTCRLVYDERAAAYIALGLAQQLRTPVGLVCTSGTAAVNFAPAVVEAFYQGVPLLVLTADRPPEWIDQQDNQAIRQNDLYAPHVRGSFTFPLDDGHPDTRWYAARIAANAIDLAGGWEPGPVHINVPLREPLYAPAAQRPDGASARRAPRTWPSRARLPEEAWEGLLTQWRSAGRKLLVGGMHPTDPGLRAALTALAADRTMACFADVTANLHGLPFAPPHADALLGSRRPETIQHLSPDLVVNFGGQVTSKNIKTLLRSGTLGALWHVRPSLVAPDTYQALTDVIPMAPADFFAELAARLEQGRETAARLTAEATAESYQDVWETLAARAGASLRQVLSAAPFGEFGALQQVLSALPAGGLLQAGNSMPVRYINLLGMTEGHLPHQVNGNRGTSGIDGTVSTAVGAALATTAITTLIVGDLAFFYDRNGLWHRHLPPNLRIVVLNNHGGGIFDVIEGPNKLERARQEAWFLTPQPLSARRTAEDHGLRYFEARGSSELSDLLGVFLAPAGGAALLEIETDMATNTATYNAVKAALAAL